MASPRGVPEVLQQTAVIGGSGYLGKAVSERLLQLGVQIRILDLYPPTFDIQAASFLTCDVREPLRLAEALSGVQSVIHVAGVIDIRRHYHPTASEEVNVQGTANVVRACRATGVQRMIYISTSNVLMEERECLDISEESSVPLRQCTEYSRTKLLAERLVLEEAHREGGMLVTVLRPPWIWGPGEGNFWTVAANPLPLAVRTGYCNAIYVRNAANAAIHAAHRLCDRDAASHGQAVFIKDPLNGGTGLVHCQLLYRCEVAGRSLPPWDVPFLVLLWSAWLVDLLCGVVWFLFRVHLQRGDGFTQYAIWAGFGHHTICDNKARKLLGQWPEVSMKQAIMETKAHYQIS